MSLPQPERAGLPAVCGFDARRLQFCCATAPIGREAQGLNDMYTKVVAWTGLVLCVLLCLAPGGDALAKFGAAREYPEYYVRVALAGCAMATGLGLGRPASAPVTGLDLLIGVNVVALVALGVWNNLIDPVRGVLLAILAIGGAASLLRAVRALPSDPIQVESNWGGLGGGIGGWRVSGPLAPLVIGLACVGAAVAIVAGLPPPRAEPPGGQKPGAAAGATPPAKPPASGAAAQGH